MSANHRLLRCTRYLLASVFKPCLVFLGIYLLAAYGLPLLLRVTTTGSITYTPFGPNSMISSIVFLFAGAIFLFVGGYAGFREDYNFLLAMSNTWRNQYGAALLRTAAVAAGFTAVSFLMGWFERLFNQVVGLSQINDPGVISTYVYPLNGHQPYSLAGEILLVFAAFLTVFLFGQTAAVFSYRWGARFTVAFWILFGTSYIFLPIMTGTSEGFRRFAMWFLGEGGRDTLINVGWHLLVVSALLIALTGLGMRRLPQNA
ncbi:MAG: hypothetical protein PHX81_10875 [Eubacteriales bacterium]|nr:hypothetical protein [Eubacteriales bacterium]